MSLEAYAQAVHNSTNFILYRKNRSNYYRYISHLDQMVNTLFISVYHYSDQYAQVVVKESN